MDSLMVAKYISTKKRTMSTSMRPSQGRFTNGSHQYSFVIRVATFMLVYQVEHSLKNCVQLCSSGLNPGTRIPTTEGSGSCPWLTYDCIICIDRTYQDFEDEDGFRNQVASLPLE